jgi:hypothetical protein
MEKSATVGAISKAIAAAQVKMGAAKFDSKNPHFNSRYASLASVMEAVKPMADVGIAITQDCSVIRDGNGAQVVVTTMLSHAESGEWITGNISMKVERDTPQGVGSALTYARRYAISSIAGIAADEDDDSEGAEPARKAPVSAPKASKPAPAPKVDPEKSEAVANMVAEFGGKVVQDSKKISEEIGIIREGLKSLGVKTLPQMQDAAFVVINRKPEGLTDLSADERKAMLAEITRQQGIVALEATK